MKLDSKSPTCSEEYHLPLPATFPLSALLPRGTRDHRPHPGRWPAPAGQLWVGSPLWFPAPPPASPGVNTARAALGTESVWTGWSTLLSPATPHLGGSSPRSLLSHPLALGVSIPPIPRAPHWDPRYRPSGTQVKCPSGRKMKHREAPLAFTPAACPPGTCPSPPATRTPPAQGGLVPSPARPPGLCAPEASREESRPRDFHPLP